MGNCGATEEERVISSNIDKELKKNKPPPGEAKLLLLGPGESGKSTIVKQLRILNQKDQENQGDSSTPWISDEERNGYKTIIHSNTILSMSALLKALERTEEYEQLSEDQKQNAILLLSPEINATPELNVDVASAVKSLWKSEFVHQRFINKSDVQIIDSASYFFDNIDRLAEPDFIPTDQDILYSRTRTTGITEFCFQLAGTPMRLVDVGGQRSERRKWIHCFDEVTSIFFIVAISEFDQRLREDEATNRLTESFSLFREVCDYEAFTKIPIILFLNKSDLFEQKIVEYKMRLSDFFPEYTGENKVDAILDWMKKKFNDAAHPRQIYSHVTCATNTENVETVFGAVQKFLMDGTLTVTGLI